MPGNRRTIRLKEYDYAQEGAYSVTICTHNRIQYFGCVVDDEMVLNVYGKMVDKYWNEIPKHFPQVELDEYIVMPNHLHGIIVIIGNNVGAGFPRPNTRSPRPDNDKGRGNHKGRGIRAPTLGQIVAYFKYGSTKRINAIRNTPGIRLWQRNYYDHIIRDENDLNRIREYIITNPAKWADDEYYCG